MDKILILVDNRSNLRLLSELLEGEFEIVKGNDPGVLDAPFDLAILDALSLKRHQEWIAARREAERPVFLPFLLLASRPDIGYATRQLWKIFDEMIVAPIEKIELRARLTILLRARGFSRELETRYFTLAKSAPIGVFLLKGNQVVWVNPFLEHLLGQPADALKRVPWEEWFFPEDRTVIRQAASGAGTDLTAGKIIRFATSTGIRWAEVRVTQIGPMERQGFLGVIADVTGEREVSRIKEEFLASISHELRTPLTGILGFSEILLQQLQAGEELHEFAEHIHHHAEHLSQMVGDLLNLAQLRAGWALPIEKSTFDLRLALESLLNRFRQNHPHRDFIFRSPAKVVICADHGLIIQALTNVLKNSVKFSPDGAPVEVVLQTGESGVSIEIIDQGVGMGPEEVARAPNVFYRADSSTTAIGGFGVGLTVARTILEEHGGTLGIDSLPGKGTKVTFNLPF